MAGVVYDKNENTTLQNYVNQQQELFKGLEDNDHTKSIIITSALVLFTTVIAVVVLKRVLKK